MHQFIETLDPYARSAHQYDRLLARPMLPIIVRNFRHIIKKHRICFSNAADVGCGTGRFVRFLAQTGAGVVGVDRSPVMIKIAKRLNRGNHSRFLRQDIRCLSLPELVDLITCNFDTLNYLLSLSDMQRAMTRLCANLREGGHLIFDVIVDEGRRRPECQRFSTPARHGRISWRVASDGRFRRVTLLHRYRDLLGAKRCAREVHLQRAFPISSVIASVKNAGLTLLSIHDARSWRGAGREPRMIITAQRRAAHGVRP